MISMIFYQYLDPIVWKAYIVPHIPLDELPSLSDRDYVKDLVHRSSPVSTLLVNAFIVPCWTNPYSDS